jgi:hypothetical protein
LETIFAVKIYAAVQALPTADLPPFSAAQATRVVGSLAALLCGAVALVNAGRESSAAVMGALTLAMPVVRSRCGRGC